MKKDAVILIEPVRVRNSEVCLLNDEVMPTVPVRTTERPLATNSVITRDPARFFAKPFV